MAPPAYRERDYEFGRQMLALRTESGLTQSALAQTLGVSRNAVSAWEGGESYPSAPHLRRLIEVCLARQAFHAGHEAEEIRTLWRDARLRVPLDEAWLVALVESSSSATAGAAPPSADPDAPATVAPRLDWGQAPEASEFYGRESELALLGMWLLEDHCRVVSLLGIGGIGKTILAVRLARETLSHYECLYWRSLRDAPPPGEWSAGAIAFLSDQRMVPPSGDAERLAALLQLLRDHRCLLVLDNFETLFEPGEEQGRYRPGMAAYGRLVEAVAEASHESCLLLTSREAPPELVRLGATHGSLTVGGLGVEEARRMLTAKQLTGNLEQWTELVGRFGGNGLALKMVGERIRELFGGELGSYLQEAASGTAFGGVRQLVSEQVERGTPVEQRLLEVLAVAREPVTVAGLLDTLGATLGRGTVLDALESMSRRSLAERVETEAGIAFTLQSVVLECLTDRVVAQVGGEVELGHPALLVEQALVRAQAPEYVRESQERLIGMPVLERLQARLGREATERRLLSLLDAWRDRPLEEQGYGPGSVVNLLRLLRGELRGLELGRLAIRQAYLADVDVHDGSFAGAHLAESVLADAFTSPVSVTLSGDGAMLAAGTSTGQIWLWRVADRTLLATLDGYPGQVFGVSLTTDGGLLAGGGMDGTVRSWDTATGRLLTTFEGHTSGVAGVAFSADGHMLASGSFDGTIRLWAGDAGRPLASLGGHTGTVWSVSLSADGHVLASGGADGTVRLWETEGGRPLSILTGHTGEIWGVALSADGRLLASGSLDETVRLWETASGRCVGILRGHTGGVWKVAISANGRLVASSGADDVVRLWEASGGRRLATLTSHRGGVSAVALSADGRLLASGSFDQTVRLWEVSGGQALATLQGHACGVWRVALSADGALVASTGNGGDGAVRLWETSTGRLITTLEGHTDQATVAISSDGRLVASGGIEGTVRLWQAPSGRLIATLKGHTSEVWGVALSADGRLVASCGLDATVRLWEAPSGRPLATLDAHAGAVRVVALSADGRLLVSGDADGELRLWETPAGRPLATIAGHAGGVRGVALSADGHLLASGGLEGTVRLWETPTGRPLATLEGHTGPVWSVALSADGRLLGSSSADGTVRLWETAGGRPLATLRGHAGPIPAVALTADGGLLASGGWDGTVRLWETSGGAPGRTLQLERRYERMDITGLTGVTPAQRAALIALGAVERSL